MKPFASVPDKPSGLITVTPNGPAAFDAVLAVRVVALTTVTLVAAAPPIVTVAPATKFVPETVIVVPPVVGPLAGLTLDTVGGGCALMNRLKMFAVTIWIRESTML